MILCVCFLNIKQYTKRKMTDTRTLKQIFKWQRMKLSNNKEEWTSIFTTTEHLFFIDNQTITFPGACCSKNLTNGSVLRKTWKQFKKKIQMMRNMQISALNIVFGSKLVISKTNYTACCLIQLNADSLKYPFTCWSVYLICLLILTIQMLI